MYPVYCWLDWHAPIMPTVMVDSCNTAFRDGGAGSGANRRKPTDENARGGARGGRGARGRGGESGFDYSDPYVAIGILTGQIQAVAQPITATLTTGTLRT